MKPAPFEYHAPTTRDEALALLAEGGFDAKVLAGGQSLVPAMNFRLARPALLIDVNRIDDLSGIRPADDGGVSIGALTRQRAVERSPLIAERLPLLAEAMPHIAHPQIRSRGTIGGSLAHADPAAELPALSLALDARLRLQSQQAERWLPAAEFFLGILTTALEPEELLVEIAIPALPPRTGTAFDEVARRHGDYAMAGAAAVVTLAEDGTIAESRLVLLAVGDIPVPIRSVTQALRGAQPTEDAIRAAVESIDAEIDPPTDLHATAAYRRYLVKNLARSTLLRAVERACQPIC
ncbi:MAG TPA: xanthine dehydrogenase family protein subunit M [Herpetosiphonaceae bacterium]